ncbi:MAG: hypothetical protein AB4038_14210 [Prochloraceae cyanobacterium]
MFSQLVEIDSDHLTLKEGVEIIYVNEQSDIPFIVWLLENPHSLVALPGKITLYNHDCLHILLERDLSLEDEAFVIGFTMGNDIQTKSFDLEIYKFLAKLLYPQKYKFNSHHFKFFNLGFSYGRNLEIKNLNQINFRKYKDKTIAEVRKLFGIKLEELRLMRKLEK